MNDCIASLAALDHRKAIFTVSSVGSIIAGALGVALPVHADLRTISGINEAQLNIATSIHRVCPSLAANTSRTAPEENLFVTCNRMIQTSNALQSVQPATNALNLTENELIVALDELTHEESVARASKGRDTAQLQHANIVARLGSLRAGGVGSSGSVSLRKNDPWLAADTDPATILRGGAAGDNGNSRWSVFVNGGIGFGDKGATTREDGFDYDDLGATVGADLALDANSFVGAAVGYSETEIDFDGSADEAQQGSASVSLYGTRFTGTWYFDVIGIYGEDDYDTTRDVSLLAETLNDEEAAALRGALPSRIYGSTAGTHSGVSLGLGRNIETGPTVWTPYARYSYYKADVDAYSEAGDSGVELTLADQEVKSRELILGMDVTRSISSNVGVLSPQLRIEYHRQFEYNSIAYPARYKWDNTHDWWNAPSDEADRQYLVLGAGVSLVSAGGLQTFAYYETARGMSHFSTNVLVLGARKEL